MSVAKIGNKRVYFLIFSWCRWAGVGSYHQGSSAVLIQTPKCHGKSSLLKSSKQKGWLLCCILHMQYRAVWIPYLDKQLNYDSRLCWQAYKEMLVHFWKQFRLSSWISWLDTFTHLLKMIWQVSVIFHPTDFWFIVLGCWIADSLGKPSSFSHRHHCQPYCHLYHRGGQQCCHNDNLFAYTGPLGTCYFNICKI